MIRRLWGRFLDWLIGPETEVPAYDAWDPDYWDRDPR